MNEDKATVAVLMSTYNGEKYIREQLDSIFNQENVRVELYVRDDGSTDATLNILETYSKRYPVEIVIDGENVGPGESFMRLVYKYADAPGIDYYAFADQDDIWLPEKLCAAVGEIKRGEDNVPTLYSSNQYIYVDGRNEGNRHNTPQRIDLISHLTKNTIAGCTFVFNKALAQLVARAGRPDPRVIKYRLHDAWMMLVAIACGRVIYDETSYMLYRIHSENLVGVKKLSWSDKINRISKLLFSDRSNIRMITASELLRLFPIANQGDQEILHLYANYRKSFKNKLQLLTNADVFSECQENRFTFLLKVLLGLV